MAFETLKLIVLAADADTPPALLTHVGTKVMIPQGEQVPTTYTTPGIAGIPGYGRTGSDGSAEWVMQGSRDELLAYVNKLPPAGTWQVDDSRLAWRRGARQLREMGASSAELRAILRDLLYAAHAEFTFAAPPAP